MLGRLDLKFNLWLWISSNFICNLGSQVWLEISRLILEYDLSFKIGLEVWTCHYAYPPRSFGQNLFCYFQSCCVDVGFCQEQVEQEEDLHDVRVGRLWEEVEQHQAGDVGRGHNLQWTWKQVKKIKTICIRSPIFFIFSFKHFLVSLFFIIICLPPELLPVLGLLERWCDAYTWRGPAVYFEGGFWSGSWVRFIIRCSLTSNE